MDNLLLCSMSWFSLSDWCVLFCFQKSFLIFTFLQKWPWKMSQKFHTCFPHGEAEGPEKLSKFFTCATKELWVLERLWKYSQNGNETSASLGYLSCLFKMKSFTFHQFVGDCFLSHVNLESPLIGTRTSQSFIMRSLFSSVSCLIQTQPFSGWADHCW